MARFVKLLCCSGSAPTERNDGIEREMTMLFCIEEITYGSADRQKLQLGSFVSCCRFEPDLGRWTGASFFYVRLLCNHEAPKGSQQRRIIIARHKWMCNLGRRGANKTTVAGDVSLARAVGFAGLRGTF